MNLSMLNIKLWSMLKLIQKIPLFVFLNLFIANCYGVSFNEKDFLSWLALNQSSNVNFSAGEVVHYADKERFRAFVPPGYVDILFFDKMAFTLQPSRKFLPALSYQQATKLFAGKPFLDEDGVLKNY